MKEYKIATVRLGYQEEPDHSESPSTIAKNVRALFFADECPAGRVLTEKAEELMEEMDREGWEIAGTSALGRYPDDVTLIITFSREMQTLDQGRYGP